MHQPCDSSCNLGNAQSLHHHHYRIKILKKGAFDSWIDFVSVDLNLPITVLFFLKSGALPLAKMIPLLHHAVRGVAPRPFQTAHLCAAVAAGNKRRR